MLSVAPLDGRPYGNYNADGCNVKRYRTSWLLDIGMPDALEVSLRFNPELLRGSSNLLLKSMPLEPGRDPNLAAPVIQSLGACVPGLGVMLLHRDPIAVRRSLEPVSLKSEFHAEGSSLAEVTLQRAGAAHRVILDQIGRAHV